MTTDAKIGLLLGLVFIVIIAFVINGLPSFNRSSQTNDLTDKYVQQVGNQPIGLPQNLDSINNNTSPTTIDITGNKPAESPVAKVDGSYKITGANAPIRVPQDSNTLPGPNSTVVAAENSPSIDAATLKAAQDAVAKLNENKTGSPEQTNLEVQPVAAMKVRTYKVKKGDTLAVIAAKYYGADAKKQSTLDALIKDNHLKSAKQLSIGQKLIIPDITLATVQPTLFEKVEQMSRRTLGMENTNIAASDQPAQPQTQTPAPVEASNENYYVVQSKDNPWKIAAKQLGNGNRFKEIIAANPGIFKGGKDVTLSVGMRLKMPSR